MLPDIGETEDDLGIEMGLIKNWMKGRMQFTN